MRKLTDHIVSKDQSHQLLIEVLDEPGSGGANHAYSVTTPPDPKHPSFVMSFPFQNGPIGEVGVNGLSHEALLAILLDRMRGFQNGPYKCRENAIALTHLEEALMWLQKRTLERLTRGVEGTHTV